ncbi:MAG: beta-ketoacyl synthase N-terminal-like domain-containing protein, partial [Pseudomonadales bacterium]
HGFYGADFPYNTACTSSANAILAASQAVRSGLTRHALVIGLETFNVTTLSGFAGMQLLANDVMRPFDRRRNGLVLGEGCAALLFHAASDDRGLSVCGAASQCDTHSISASNPNGTSIAEVMRSALADAGIDAGMIEAIKAHGTASPLNDNGEAAGMHQVFPQIPPVFCIKPYVGHTLGACGAIEFALLATALRENIIPASAGFSEVDPELNLRSTTAVQAAHAGFYMLNFFGFGGNNCSMVVQHKPAHEQ